MYPIQCNKCKQIVMSMHLHDYVKCDCGAVGVDGGNITPRYIGDIGNISILLFKNKLYVNLTVHVSGIILPYCCLL